MEESRRVWMRIRRCRDCDSLYEVVGRVHGVDWASRERHVVVLPHPSGLSRWLNRTEHRDLHRRSLEILGRAWNPIVA